MAALAVTGFAVWLAPAVAVLTNLRDRPLVAAFEGIDGTVASGSAKWNWLHGIEYRDVVINDHNGKTIAHLPLVQLDRGLLHLSFDLTSLGTVRLFSPQIFIEVRSGSTTLEDLLAPWLARSSSNASIRATIEVSDGRLELVDSVRQDTWQLDGLMASASIRPELRSGGWTVSGRLEHLIQNGAAMASLASTVKPAPSVIEGNPATTRSVAVAATTALSREGGWSVSAPENTDGLVITTNHLPLGFSRVVATRFSWPLVVDGFADVRLDIDPGSTSSETRVPLRIAGLANGSRIVISDAISGSERFNIDRCEIPLELSLDGDRLRIGKLSATSPLIRAEAAGSIRLVRGGPWEWLDSLSREDFAFSAEIDLAAVSKATPGGLQIRPDVKVTGGQLQLSASAHGDGDARVFEIRAGSLDLSAVQGERLLRWNEPFSAWLKARRIGTSDSVVVEEARLTSTAIEISGKGTAANSTLEYSVDLDTFLSEVSEVIDTKNVELAGIARGTLQFAKGDAAESFIATATTSLTDFVVAMPSRSPWRDSQLTLESQIRGTLSPTALVIDSAQMIAGAQEDRMEVMLTGGMLVDLWSGGSLFRTAPAVEQVTADLTLSGDLARWQGRLSGWPGAPLPGGFSLAGRGALSAAVTARGTQWEITRAGGELENVVLEVGARRIEEPRVVTSAVALWQPSTGNFEISSAEVLTASVSLRSKNVIVSSARPGSLWNIFENVRGKMEWQADVARVEKWLLTPLAAASWPAGGRAWGTAELSDDPEGIRLRMQVTGSQLALASVSATAALGIGPASAPKPVWSEPKASASIEVIHARGIDQLIVRQASLESATATFSAAGTIDAASGQRVVDLNGTVGYDWDAVSHLLSPWTKSIIHLSGGGARPFALRGPLRGTAQKGSPRTRGIMAGVPFALPDRSATENTPRSLALPADWLDAARGLDQAAEETLVLPPLKTPLQTHSLLHALAAETSIAWTAGDVEGLSIDAGDMAVRLFDGQLALGPLDIGISGGRLRAAPWIRLSPEPMELVIPPSRLLENVTLSEHACDRWLRTIAPLLAQSTRAQGRVSIDLANARVPLGDPLSGDISGRILFDTFEVTPGAPAAPLVMLVRKLQTLIDPTLAFNDKQLFIRVRNEPVRFRLVERRIWHDGLIMDTGQVVAKTSGSVGADGSLAMNLELSFRGDVVGTTPIVAALVKTPLVVPLRGTVNQPQFDSSQIDIMLARIVEHAVKNVIADSIGRGLEGLLGIPKAPPAP